MRAFYVPDGDTFVSTELTRGPWDDRFQHGGPPSALLARALHHDDFVLSRLTVSLLRPVPIAPLRVEVDPVRGRTAQRPVARLWAGHDVVAEGRGVRIRRLAMDVPPPDPPAPWPDPETLAPYRFTFFRNPVGYHTAVELRIAHGTWGRTPVGFYTRPTAALVAGEPTSAVERLVILADAQSGMGPPLDPLRYTFVNPDLTVYLERVPRGPWIGFDIRSTAGPEGSGLSHSIIRDEGGVVGICAQAMVIAPRSAQ